MERADFGLTISGINRGRGGENVRPQRVSGTHEPDTERENPLFFKKKKKGNKNVISVKQKSYYVKIKGWL